MLEILKTVITRVIPLLVVACFLYFPSIAIAKSSDTAERVAKMAMSTASLSMMEHHKHKMEEGLEKGDIKEALEEAEELVLWMEGTPWLDELLPHAKKATEAVKKVIEKLKANDTKGAQSAFKDVKINFYHLHHELMEIVSEEGKKEIHHH